MSKSELTSAIARDSSASRATYDRGKARVVDILEGARQLFVDHGMAEFSMRRLARDLNMSVGNLTYYYASKDALLSDLMAYVLVPYLTRFAEFGRAVEGEPIEHLRAVLDYVVQDLGEYETTRFFPELWVLANRDERTKNHMEELYGAYRKVLVDLISRIRPDLLPQTQQDLALMMQSSIEGHTMFIGHKRAHADRLSALKPRLVEHCIALVRDAKD